MIHKREKTPADQKQLLRDLAKVVEGDNIYNNNLPKHMRGPNAMLPRNSTQERFQAPRERAVFTPFDSGFDAQLEAMHIKNMADLLTDLGEVGRWPPHRVTAG